MMLRVAEMHNEGKLLNESNQMDDMYLLDLNSNRTLRLDEIDLLNEILMPHSPKVYNTTSNYEMLNYDE